MLAERFISESVKSPSRSITLDIAVPKPRPNLGQILFAELLEGALDFLYGTHVATVVAGDCFASRSFLLGVRGEPRAAPWRRLSSTDNAGLSGLAP